MACNRQIEKVTYDLGCQGFSLFGEEGQAFPNESMGSEGREVKLKFSGGRSPKFWWGNFCLQKDVVLTYVLQNFCFTRSIPKFLLCTDFCAVNTTYILIMLIALNNFHYFSS